MLLSVFIADIPDKMKNTSVMDINEAYKKDIDYGNALNTPSNIDDGNHTFILNIPLLGEFTIPYIGELLYFISSILWLIWDVLTTLFGVLEDIALLSTKFPSFLVPVIALVQMIILLAWYKVLYPGE